MLSLHQKELSDWQDKNFGNTNSTVETVWCLAGMIEELGEFAHALLKSVQGIRGISKEQADKEMADAFGDIVIYGTQAMTTRNIDAEKAISDTIAEVLNRDWIKYPKNGVSK
jgi:NTP pyrophosphatase (non-canonical NTP hydrolase)